MAHFIDMAFFTLIMIYCNKPLLQPSTGLCYLHYRNRIRGLHHDGVVVGLGQCRLLERQDPEIHRKDAPARDRFESFRTYSILHLISLCTRDHYVLVHTMQCRDCFWPLNFDIIFEITRSNEHVIILWLGCSCRSNDWVWVRSSSSLFLEPLASLLFYFMSW